jgi:hypothetical protein
MLFSFSFCDGKIWNSAKLLQSGDILLILRSVVPSKHNSNGKGGSDPRGLTVYDMMFRAQVSLDSNI